MTHTEDSVIEVEDLRKQFGDFTAVGGVSFHVRRGEIFAFLGPNGAGKSTTVKMLTTLLSPSAGHLSVNGFDPVAEQDEVRRSFGVVFQDPSLDDELTARENLDFHAVLYGVDRAARRTRIDELLRFVELYDRKDDQVKTFSGGMKRRLELARGLTHHPAVLFLDEPTVGLDPQTRNHIWEYLKRVNAEEGMTIFFTTHYMEEADRVAGRVAIIDHGRIIAEGSPAELKERTSSATLEDAFLALTGHELRQEAAEGAMQRMARMWRGRRR